MGIWVYARVCGEGGLKKNREQRQEGSLTPNKELRRGWVHQASQSSVRTDCVKVVRPVHNFRGLGAGSGLQSDVYLIALLVEKKNTLGW